MKHWKNISRKQVMDNGGAGLLVAYYEGSLSLALQNVYPEYRGNIDVHHNYLFIS